MPLTEREAFKVGFMLRCADEGLSPAQTQDRVEKAAHFLKRANVSPLVPSGLSHLVPQDPIRFKAMVNASLAVPMALGAVGGYGAHKMTASDIDEEDVRKQELIDELRHWTRRAQEQQKAKMLQLSPA